METILIAQIVNSPTNFSDLIFWPGKYGQYAVYQVEMNMEKY